VTTRWWVTAGAVLILASSGTAARAQDRRQQDRNDRNQAQSQFDEVERQATRDWYNQHQSHPPAGLRNQDRLSPEQEDRLRPGAQLDPDLRNRVHTAPKDLRRRLHRPPKHQRYVTIGGHIGIIDQTNHVLDVIHLHDNR
jgi:Ni/Co efflux regulator RcnB